VVQPSRLPSDAGETPAPQSGTGETPAPQPPIPVILEKNTANYALQLWGGLGETFEISDGRNRPVRLEVAALLADSIFQGELLVDESAFLRLFPDADGYRVFLVEAPPGRIAAVQETLEQDLGEYGFSAETTGRRLAELLAVQNTYLSTFQSLGGHGAANWLCSARRDFAAPRSLGWSSWSTRRSWRPDWASARLRRRWPCCRSCSIAGPRSPGRRLPSH
jgi:hypothetical protein